MENPPPQKPQQPHYAQQAPPPPPQQPPRRKTNGCVVAGLLVVGIFFLFAMIGLIIIAHVGAIATGGNMPAAKPMGNNKIGLINLKDVILDPEETLQIIHYYKQQANIRGVLLRVDSPGGAVGASQEIYAAIQDLQDSGKMVVASFANVAASGGYYAACPADYILTNPGAMTGSIGVIFTVPNFEGLADKVGIKQETIKSGQFKDIASVTREMTPEEKQLLQSVIMDTYDQFVEAILLHREEALEAALANLPDQAPGIAAELPPDVTVEGYLKHLADGRIFTGRQAVQYGFADAVGTRADALELLGRELGIVQPEIFEYKPKKSLREWLEMQSKSALGADMLPASHPRIEYRMW